jgi:hypothetical protein
MMGIMMKPSKMNLLDSHLTMRIKQKVTRKWMKKCQVNRCITQESPTIMTIYTQDLEAYNRKVVVWTS